MTIRKLPPESVAFMTSIRDIRALTMAAKPSSIACLIKAFKLSLLAYAGGLVFGVFFWDSVLLALILMHPLSLVLALMALVAGMLWHVILWGVWSAVLKIFWSSPPRWLRAAPWQKQPLHFGVALMASLPLAIVMLARFGMTYGQMYQTTWGYVTLWEHQASGELFSAIALRFYGLWVGAAMACYTVVRQWLE
jgi:hypothetical protein